MWGRLRAILPSPRVLIWVGAALLLVPYPALRPPMAAMNPGFSPGMVAPGGATELPVPVNVDGANSWEPASCSFAAQWTSEQIRAGLSSAQITAQLVQMDALAYRPSSGKRLPWLRPGVRLRLPNEPRLAGQRVRGRVFAAIGYRRPWEGSPGLYSLLQESQTLEFTLQVCGRREYLGWRVFRPLVFAAAAMGLVCLLAGVLKAGVEREASGAKHVDGPVRPPDWLAEKYRGKHCAVCRQAIEVGSRFVECPDCGQWYHERCWARIKVCIREQCPSKRTVPVIYAPRAAPKGLPSVDELCPHCQTPVPAAQALRCRTCGTAHHKECMRDNGGCAAYSCKDRAAGAITRRPADRAPIITAESPASLRAARHVVGFCPFCQTGVVAGAAVVRCPKCDIPHHSDCWEENGGCSIPGCPGGRR